MTTLTDIRSAAKRRAARRPRWSARLLWLLKLTLLTLALYLTWRLGSRIGWSDLGRRLGTTDPLLVGLATLLLVGRWVSVHLRWGLALAAGEEARRSGRAPGSHPLRFAVLLAAVLVNHLTPGARIFGGVLRARYLRAEGDATFPGLYATVLADQASHHLVQIPLAWLALIGAAFTLGRLGLALAGALALAGVVAAVALWRRPGERENQSLAGRLARRIAERQRRFVGPVAEGGREVARRFRRLFTDRRLQLRAAAFGVAYFACSAAAQWLVFRALGSSPSWLVVAATTALGTGAGFLTGTPGGLGTTEAAMVGGYVLLGVEREAALAATLLYRGLHYALVLGLGAPSLTWLELGAPRKRRRAARLGAPDPVADRPER